MLMKRSSDAIERDIGTLANFIGIYCGRTHARQEKKRVQAGGAVGTLVNRHAVALCGECAALLLHAASKRLICPYDPKPNCKRCPTHCYAPGHRERIRAVMRFSGMYLVRRGRIDLLLHFFR